MYMTDTEKLILFLSEKGLFIKELGLNKAPTCKPHDNCCTCQKCGWPDDACVCNHNYWVDIFLNKNEGKD
jgi:hypothetical protein